MASRLIRSTLLGAAVLYFCPVFAQETTQPLSAEAQQIIQQYNMQHIPHEGPYFLQTAKSEEILGGEITKRYQGPRYAYTAIISMITKVDFSAFHQLKTDEIWHFYGGAPAEIVMLYPDGKHEVIVFGSEILRGQQVQVVVPRGVWMGARLLPGAEKDFTLFGATMAPGFEYQDYTAGNRQQLLNAYSDQAERIIALTRPDKDVELTDGGQLKAAQNHIQIEELIGLNGPVVNTATSVAKVSMAAHSQLPTSYNKQNTEVVIVVSGTGVVTIAGKPTPLTPNAVVLLPPQVHYKFRADSDLVFYAIVSPAFEPSDHIELDE